MRPHATYPQRSRRNARALASLALTSVVGFVLLFSAALTPAASATEQHLFNPVLSLTGDCSSNATTLPDTVPDPDCAGSPLEYPPAPHRPIGAFTNACGAATDSHGYIYVASGPVESGHGPKSARIDIFNPNGHFITEIKTGEEGLENTCRLTVDSKGRVYVNALPYIYAGKILRYTPKSYPPGEEEHAYGPAESFVGTGAIEGVAVDPSNDYVYVATGPVHEYTPAGTLVGTFSYSASDIAVWGRNHYSYMVRNAGADVAIYDAAHNLIQEIPLTGGNGTPYASIAVDQANGDFYVHLCTAGHCRIAQYGAVGPGGAYTLIGEFGAEQNLTSAIGRSDLTVDDPCLTELKASCDLAGYSSPNAGYVFVNSGAEANSHLFAFAPLVIGPPAISEQTVSQVTTNAATLRGRVAPEGAASEYRFEYVSEADFLESGWTDATSVGAGQIAEPKAPATPVSAPIVGLSSGTSYRFRIVASNHCNPLKAQEVCTTEGERKGSEEVPRTFATYPTPEGPPSCSNELFRTGPSALLPDCRAYELVTPPSTIVPNWVEVGSFDPLLATPGGESLLFGSLSGALPSAEGNGIFEGYEALRGAAGWKSHTVAPNGALAGYAQSVGVAPDHAYSVWSDRESWGGSFEVPGCVEAEFIRNPDGSFETVCAWQPGRRSVPEGEVDHRRCGSSDLRDRRPGVRRMQTGAA